MLQKYRTNNAKKIKADTFFLQQEVLKENSKRNCYKRYLKNPKMVLSSGPRIPFLKAITLQNCCLLRQKKHLNNVKRKRFYFQVLKV